MGKKKSRNAVRGSKGANRWVHNRIREGIDSSGSSAYNFKPIQQQHLTINDERNRSTTPPSSSESSRPRSAITLEQKEVLHETIVQISLFNRTYTPVNPSTPQSLGSLSSPEEEKEEEEEEEETNSFGI